MLRTIINDNLDHYAIKSFLLNLYEISYSYRQHIPYTSVLA